MTTSSGTYTLKDLVLEKIKLSTDRHDILESKISELCEAFQTGNITKEGLVQLESDIAWALRDWSEATEDCDLHIKTFGSTLFDSVGGFNPNA